MTDVERWRVAPLLGQIYAAIVARKTVVLTRQHRSLLRLWMNTTPLKRGTVESKIAQAVRNAGKA